VITNPPCPWLLRVHSPPCICVPSRFAPFPVQMPFRLGVSKLSREIIRGIGDSRRDEAMLRMRSKTQPGDVCRREGPLSRADAAGSGAV
jgi:hypothetical protein